MGRKNSRKDAYKYRQRKHREYNVTDSTITTFCDGEKEYKEFKYGTRSMASGKQQGADPKAMSKLAKAKMKYDETVSKDETTVVNDLRSKAQTQGVSNNFGKDANKVRETLLKSDTLAFLEFERDKNNNYTNAYMIICRNDMSMSIIKVYYVKINNAINYVNEVVLTDERNIGKVVNEQNLLLTIREINWLLEEYNIGYVFVCTQNSKNAYKFETEKCNITENVAVQKLYDKLIRMDSFIASVVAGRYIDELMQLTTNNYFIDTLVNKLSIRRKDGYYNKKDFGALKLYCLARRLKLNKEAINELTFVDIANMYSGTFKLTFLSEWNDLDIKLIERLVHDGQYKKLYILLCDAEYILSELSRQGMKGVDGTANGTANEDGDGGVASELTEYTYVRLRNDTRKLMKRSKFNESEYSSIDIIYNFKGSNISLDDMYKLRYLGENWVGVD